MEIAEISGVPGVPGVPGIVEKVFRNAELFYNPKIVKITDTVFEYTPEKITKNKGYFDDPKMNHCFALVSASLQYNFWIGTSEIRIDGINSQWINEMLYQEIIDAGMQSHFGFKDLKYLIKDKLIQTDIPLLDERLKSIDEIFSIDFDAYGYLFDNTIRSLSFIQKIPGFKKDPFFKKGFFAIQYSNQLNGISSDVLPVPADYQIPKVLHSLGIIEYSSELENKIQNDYILQENSKEELAIRAATVKACKIISENNNITPGELDYFLFSNRNDIEEKHHLCYTTNY